MAGVSSRKVRWFPVSRLALKIAGPVAAFAAVVFFAAAGLGIPVLPAVLLGIVLLGGFTYVLTYLTLVRRLASAGRMLEQIRQHPFETVKAVHLPRGDELNALLWQVYRTGLTVERELNELRRMETYRREFLGNVSHELKTPIFAIQGFAETLLDGGLEDERVNRSFLEKILRNTRRLSTLARDLAEISRIETGEFTLNPQPFSLPRLVREVMESLEPAAQANHVVLRTAVPDDLPPAAGDRERIRQVLINLADNAIKYNRSGGYAELSVIQLPSGDLQITVADNGIGVAPADIPRLTERFYRVDKSRSRGPGGSGLGLAIVKHLLGAHNRALLIESQPGKGSVFSFTLPVAPERT